MTKQKSKMDPRCPRKLDYLPEEWCTLAVLRLRALRNADKELSEEEESLLQGCPWAIKSQISNYCFFKYITDFLEDKPLSDSDIAHLNIISINTVRKLVISALEKIRNSNFIKEIDTIYDGDPIFSDSIDPDEEHVVYNIKLRGK
jgi:hypothetical protein